MAPGAAKKPYYFGSKYSHIRAPSRSPSSDCPQRYKSLLCFTILYRTRIPPMLNLVETVAAGRAGCHGYNLCKLIEARSAVAPDLVRIYIETSNWVIGVEHA
jgi:hypothetical protein